MVGFKSCIKYSSASSQTEVVRVTVYYNPTIFITNFIGQKNSEVCDKGLWIVTCRIFTLNSNKPHVITGYKEKCSHITNLHVIS
jgi:hypothetical protein